MAAVGAPMITNIMAPYPECSHTVSFISNLPQHDISKHSLVVFIPGPSNVVPFWLLYWVC